MKNIDGFNEVLTKNQYVLQFVMPMELQRIFKVELYGRGALLDIADGDPSLIWKVISANCIEKNLVAPQQVHLTRIISAEKCFALPLRPEADGVYMDCNTRCAAGLRYADCAPVVIAGCEPNPWLYILHSGFAGTFSNIVSFAKVDLLSRFAKRSLSVDKTTWAWIGPCICADCYGRSEDDYKTIMAEKRFAKNNFYKKQGKIHFDLKNEIKTQLIALGVPKRNIYISQKCTYSDNNKFYSYRAGDKNKRMLLLAQTMCQN